MKKIILILAMLTATVSIYSQNDELNKWSKQINPTSAKQQKGKAPNHMQEASLLLKKSATYQYVALGCGGAAAGMAITASIIGTKKYNKDLPSNELNDKGESDRKLRRGLYIGAGLFAAAAICLEIVAIDYKTKAGNKIKLYSTGTGAGLAYVF